MGGKGSGRTLGSKSRVWSAWDDHIIKVNLDLGAEAIAEWLEVSISAVRARAFKLGLKFSPPTRSDTNLRERPFCKICNLKPAASNGRDRRGNRRWSRCCSTCKYRSYTQHKKKLCEKCGFIPEHSSQLDVDHIDGNASNNDPNNLMTLCANCHRLKTYINNDWHNGR